MSNYVTERRDAIRCKHCGSPFVSFRLSPLPTARDLTIACNDKNCGKEYPAQRETDREEFRKLAAEFNG